MYYRASGKSSKRLADYQYIVVEIKKSKYKSMREIQGRHKKLGGAEEHNCILQ